MCCGLGILGLAGLVSIRNQRTFLPRLSGSGTDPDGIGGAISAVGSGVQSGVR